MPTANLIATGVACSGGSIAARVKLAASVDVAVARALGLADEVAADLVSSNRS